MSRRWSWRRRHAVGTGTGPRRLRCPICEMPWATRTLVDLALSEGTSVRAVATAFGVSRGVLRRHADHGERDG